MKHPEVRDARALVERFPQNDAAHELCGDGEHVDVKDVVVEFLKTVR
jgi:hypothetical protein